MSDKKVLSDKRIFYKINQAQRILAKYANQKNIERLGIPTVQIAALFYLRKHDGCQLKDLTNALPQNKSATTTLVDRMKKNDLIVKNKSKSDGRAFHIFLTDKGMNIAEKALPLLSEDNRGLTDQFSDSEIEVVHRFLDTIIEKYG